jgi:hypothetical protein
MSSEVDLVEAIREALENGFRDSVWYKIHGGRFQEKGIADLLGCVEGVFFALEVKLPGKEDTLSPAQGYQIRRVLKAKGHSAMVSSIPQAFTQVRRGLKNRR